MKSTGMFIAGGLLAGAGQAITKAADERRQNALLALKRQWDVEDNEAAAQNKLDVVTQQGINRVDEITATGEQNRETEKVKGEQDRLKEATKGEEDRKTAKFKGGIDLSHDTQIEAIRHKYNLSEIQARSLADYQKEAKLNHSTPDHYEVAANGQIVIWNKDGTTRGAIGADGQFVAKSSGDDSLDLGGTGGGTGSQPAPAPKATAKAPTADQENVRRKALADLGNLYGKVRTDPDKYKSQYPGMFDAQGNLRPIDELKNQINSRYGAQ